MNEDVSILIIAASINCHNEFHPADAPDLATQNIENSAEKLLFHSRIGNNK